MIISASRRTDIPAFFARDFMTWIRAGFRSVRTPYSGRESRVSLVPQDVDCIVFWTKNPKPMLPFLPELAERGFHFYFQFTLTPYDERIERHLPPKTDLLKTFQQLSRMIGKERVIWRYDPIIFSDDLGWDAARHPDMFSRMADQIAPYAGQCIISFMDFYGKCLKRPDCRIFREPSQDEMLPLAGNIADTASQYGLAVNACAEKLDMTPVGIGQASCIDASSIERLTGRALSIEKDKYQRRECGCAASRDIGSYGTCRHDCVYCYAN